MADRRRHADRRRAEWTCRPGRRRIEAGGENPDRLARPLCLRHADRRRRARRHLHADSDCRMTAVTNVAGFPILSLITFLPLIGCVVIMTVRGDEETIASNARWTALWTSLLVFALSLVLWVQFDPTDPGFQF